MLSIKHSSISTCKTFFKQCNNIINHTACIINPHGVHIYSANHKFSIFAILDNETFNHFECPHEIILQLSIQKINEIFSKHTAYHSLQITYNNCNSDSIQFIINKNTMYRIPCSIITNQKYIQKIKKINDVDNDVDYHVEFKVNPSYLYSIFKSVKQQNTQHKKKITLTSHPDTQTIYIQNRPLEHSSLDTYRFVTPIKQTFYLEYIHQFIKNTIKNKFTSIEIGLYNDKSMKLELYINDYNYIHLYIPPL